MAQSMNLGGGGRFAALKSELARGGAESPGGLAAAIGRKKYGKKKFQKMAAKGAGKAPAPMSDNDADDRK